MKRVSAFFMMAALFVTVLNTTSIPVVFVNEAFADQEWEGWNEAWISCDGEIPLYLGFAITEWGPTEVDCAAGWTSDPNICVFLDACIMVRCCFGSYAPAEQRIEECTGEVQ